VPRDDLAPGQYLRRTVEERIRRLRQGKGTLRVAGASPLWRVSSEAKLHTYAELFLQAQGMTEFELPDGKILLKPGETLLVPAGVAHGETCRCPRATFRNVVVMLYGGLTQVHLAEGDDGEKPHCAYIEEFRHDTPPVLYDLVDACSGAAYRDGPPALREGLALAVLGSVQALLLSPTLAPAGNPRVASVMQRARQQLGNPALSVKSLARELRLNADYLSHLFRTETGEALGACISRLRMELAMHYLQHSPLNVSEIARLCGCPDASYFAQLFRRHFDMTPRECRKKMQARH